MNNKPSYKEFIFNKQGNFIKSSNGHFYRICRSKFSLFLHELLEYSLLIPAIIIFVLPYDSVWPNICFDLIIIAFVFARLVKRVLYRLSSFEIVCNPFDTHTAKRNPLRPSQIKNRLIFMYIAIFLIFLNSLTFMHIRSFVSHQPFIQSIVINHNPNLVSPDSLSVDSESSYIYIEDDSAVLIELETANTPYSFNLTIDGKPVPVYRETRKMSWFYESDFFLKSSVYITDAYKNNSVLEISSGSYSRQWTIRTE